jgi:hypothetical protein
VQVDILIYNLSGEIWKPNAERTVRHGRELVQKEEMSVEVARMCRRENSAEQQTGHGMQRICLIQTGGNGDIWYLSAETFHAADARGFQRREAQGDGRSASDQEPFLDL